MQKPLNVGFVGAGWMGATQLRRLSEREDVRVRMLCETNPQRGREVLDALRLNDTLLVQDYDALVRDDEIDAVWLVSPNAFHGPQSIAALNADKHVFCEKPAATSFADHRRQIALARAKPHLKTFVDYILYFDSFEQRLRDMVASGAFGTVTQMQVNYRHPVNIVDDKAWKLRRQMMGDAIGMGINHAVSVVLLAMAAQARPVSVYATSMSAQVRRFEADPIWNIQLRFDNDAAAFIFGNIDSCNGYDAYHSVYGAEGALIFDSLVDRPNKVRLWSRGVNGGKWVYPLDAERCAADGVAPWPADTTTPDSGDVVEHQTGACVDHFIRCIREDRQSPLSFIHSAAVAEVGWAAQVSAQTGKPVALPLDHDEASRVLEDAELTEVRP